jgi:hypothetical protein
MSSYRHDSGTLIAIADIWPSLQGRIISSAGKIKISMQAGAIFPPVVVVAEPTGAAPD